MINVLVIFDSHIKAWLINETLESASVHVHHGYPELSEGWDSGTVKAAVIIVPESDIYRADLYHIANGTVIKIEE